MVAAEIVANVSTSMPSVGGAARHSLNDYAL
jgi:hypothetical protein